MTSELIERLEAAANSPAKWVLVGMLTMRLLEVEARYSFRTGDGNRLCRHDKAVQARADINRLAALRAHSTGMEGEKTQ